MERNKFLPAKNLIIIVAAFLIALFGALFIMPETAYAQSTPGIIVIDPGHNVYNNGNFDCGAIAPDGSINEATLNMQLAPKIALELKNRGYSVYSTLYMPAAPEIPSLLSNTCTLAQRAAISSTVQADIYISIHHNSSGKIWSTAAGVSVLYDSAQSASVLPRSMDMASIMASSIRSLGYTVGNRSGGGVVDQSINGGASVLRYNAVPAITVETGFVTNQAELVQLKDLSKQAEVAKKVADGVTNYFKKYPGKYSQPVLSMLALETPTAVSTYNTSFWMAAGINPVGRTISSMCFNVFNVDVGRQTSYKYNGTQDANGVWWAAFNFANHAKSYGTYAVEVYVTDSMGNTFGLGYKLIKVVNEPPVMTSLSLDGANPASTTNTNFPMAANINPKGKTIQSMIFNVFNMDVGRQTSAVYNGTKDSNGTWRAAFDIARHGYKYGNYAVEVYVTDTDGVSYGLGYRTIQVKDTPPVMTSITLDGTNPAATYNTSFSMAASIDAKAKTISSVIFNVFNADIGRQSSATYTGTKEPDGTWKATFDIGKHGSAYGNYAVEVYVTDTKGNCYGLGAKMIVLNQKSNVALKSIGLASAGQFIQNSTYLTSFEMNASFNEYGIPVKSAFFNVFNIDQGRQTSVKYNASKGGDGIWRAAFDISRHGYKYGNYAVEVYVTDTADNSYGLGYTMIQIKDTPPVMTGITLDGTNPAATYSTGFSMAANIDAKGKTIQSMIFNVFNMDLGRQTSAVYNGTQDSNGTWRAAFDIARHGYKYGNYAVEVYMTDTGGNSYGLGYRAIQIKDTPPVMTGIVLDGTNPAATYNKGFSMAASIDAKAKTISSVIFNVFNADIGRQSSATYAGTKDTDGTWKATFDIGKHGSAYGNYAVEVYVTDTKGDCYGLGAKMIVLNPKSNAVLKNLGLASAGQTIQNSTYLTSFEMNASFNEYGIPIKSMFFNVFNTDQGRQTSVKYNAAKGGDGIWRATFDLKNHGSVYGNYGIEIYATDEAGSTLGLGGRVILILETNPTTQIQATSEPSVYAVSGPTADVTDQPKQEPVAEPTTETTLEPTVEPTAEPTQEPKTEQSAEPTAKPVQLQTEQYGIMAQTGDTKLTKDQFAEFYKKNASVIPMALTDESGVLLQVDANTVFPLYYGMSLDDFIGIVIEEASKEGVRPEVVFTQIMADTNFLRFDKTLDIKDYVFADNQAGEEIRATEKYGDAAEGIRAAVQHLKCLASTDALQTETADLLWQDVLRGTVINVQGLNNGEEIITMLKQLFMALNLSSLLKADR